jgi:hypothetical protein
MKSLLLPLAAFAAVFCLLLIGLAVGQHSQALPIDTSLDVCMPPIHAPVASIPALPALPSLPAVQRTHTEFNQQPLSTAGDLGNQLVMAGSAFHFERKCGPNGCQLVKVPDQAQQQQPADTETRRARTTVRTVAKAAVSRVRICARIRMRRG